MESDYLLIFVILFTLLYFIFYFYIVFQSVNKSQDKKPIKSGGCSTSCGALDPVSNPAYNMQQIVKQSILLEEHLINKNKRCRDCITKHFLHIIGLAEEAEMLATNKCNKYPMINESVSLYNNLFNEWIKNKDDNYNNLSVSDRLRTHRKKLIAIYFFNDNYNLENFDKSSMG